MNYLPILSTLLICNSLVSAASNDTGKKNGTPVPVTETDKNTIVSSINDIRSNVDPKAAQMPCLVWSDTLVSKAQSTANSCNPSAQTQSQAIFFSEKQQPWSNITKNWYSPEVYDIRSDECIDTGPKPCLNEKVLLNENSTSIACAVAKCPKQPNTTSDGFLTVCQFNSDAPKGILYTTSEQSCSGCASSKSCLNNLCCVSNVISNTSNAVKIEQKEIDKFEAEVKKLRDFNIPTAVRMSCLTWDNDRVAEAQKKASSCNKQIGTKTDTVHFDTKQKTLYDMLVVWANEGYEGFSGTCNNANGCVNFKALFNENSDKFGCATAKCTKPEGYLTVCSFNGTPRDRPYEIGKDACSKCQSPKICIKAKAGGCCGEPKNNKTVTN